MKQVRSKNFRQRQTLLNNTLPRMVKLRLDFQQLRSRDWKGTEQPFVGPVREVDEEMAKVIEGMRRVERLIDGLAAAAEAKGK